tara:strand:+ start:2139 stop:3683 length:1545 start_codon:yes stop_codon:yes gene_type:complete
MAAQLKHITISAPGFLGINSQDSPVGLDPAYASVADNCVIDQLGRVGARKGFEEVTTNSAAVLGTSLGIEALTEHTSRTGVTTIFSAGNNTIFSGTTTLVACTLPAGYTITANNWKIVSFNNDVYFFQKGHAPLESIAGSTTLTVLPTTGGNAVPQGNELLAAYGRLWTCDITDNTYTIYWSSLLAGDDWHGGSAGSLDLTTVWPNGYDEVVALAEHNNFLLIFGKKNIIVYSGATSPNSDLTLHDTIEGTGCVARDSIHSTGADLLFLSSRGVMSLGRLLTQKSLPLNDISKNVRTDLLTFLEAEESSEGHRQSIKAVYSPLDAFYLLTFPLSQVVYCFDMKGALENGAYRVTTWSSLKPMSFSLLSNDQLYMGQAAGIVKYAGYLDGAVKYQLRYFSNPNDFQTPANLKFLKKFNLTIIGGQNTATTLSWGYDYAATYSKQEFTFGNVNIAEYGLSEYNTEAEYTRSITVQTPSVNSSGSGSVVTVGIEAQINDAAFSIQKIDILALIGRLI